MIQHELDENLTQVRNSATDALMWLRRALWFLGEYMQEFSRSYTSIPSECLYAAYQLTLRQYHNWVVRGIFSLAMRSMPSNEDFIKSLLVSPEDLTRNKHAIMTFVRPAVLSFKLESSVLYLILAHFCSIDLQRCEAHHARNLQVNRHNQRILSEK
jgi:hypothetical protein